MERLWAPWRAEYIDAAGKESQCFLCDYWLEPNGDRERGILQRWSNWYVVLNAYPYCSGHLMLVLGRHHEGFVGLMPAEGAELAACLEQCESALRQAYVPQGLNIGVNVGRVAGAGAVGHLHVHFVPRWNGDTNFMTAVGDTRVLPESLTRSYERLLAAFSNGGMP